MDAAVHVCCAFAAHSPIMDAVAHVYFILRLHGGCLRAAMAMAALDPSSFSFRCSNLTVVYCKIYSIPVRPCQCCYCQSAVMVHMLAFHWIFPLCFLAFHPDIFFSLRSCNGRSFISAFNLPFLMRLCLTSRLSYLPCLYDAILFITAIFPIIIRFRFAFSLFRLCLKWLHLIFAFILYAPSPYLPLLKWNLRHLILSSV